MSLPQFTDTLALSEPELFKSLHDIEAELFNLRFKKATKRNFKSHEIKYAKRRLAQVKTILTFKVASSEIIEIRV
jgi:large subunit ribosomal protein L29